MRVSIPLFSRPPRLERFFLEVSPICDLKCSWQLPPLPAPSPLAKDSPVGYLWSTHKSRRSLPLRRFQAAALGSFTSVHVQAPNFAIPLFFYGGLFLLLAARCLNLVPSSNTLPPSFRRFLFERTVSPSHPLGP